MRHTGLVALAVAALLSGCGGGDERQWMKVNERYTAEEFKRDYRECLRDGKLDEKCMRDRGWVTVTTSKVEPKNPFADQLNERGRRY
jgi:hypothetical protein